MTTEILPRSWQKYAADQCVAMARSGADRALIYGCPGSGKTLGGLYVARDLKRRVGLGPKILVLTPNLAIKSQWIERAHAMGLELLPLVDVRRQLLQEELDLKESGLVLNYQQAINCRTELQSYCERHRPVVILDEVHHTETAREDRGGNRWGASIEIACASASFKICTTGTPFREGNNPIAFVQYNERQEAVANVRYPYEQAIKDGVCRPIEFDLFDGEISWRDPKGHRLVTADFAAPLPKRQRKQRLRAAVSFEGRLPLLMLRRAHARLLEIRHGGGADAAAAGLVVAEDIDHAALVAQALADISGRPPVIVHNRIDDSLDLIERFRDPAPDNKDLWIVGVSMISEGVDIPRLRVGVYLTNKTASLYFHQFCGRLARVMESRHERSFVFMPADTELDAIAREIENERFHALGEPPNRRLTREGVAGNRRELIVEDSNGDVVTKIFGGRSFAIGLVELHRGRINDFRSGHPSRQHLTDAEILQMLIDAGAIPKPPEAA